MSAKIIKPIPRPAEEGNIAPPPVPQGEAQDGPVRLSWPWGAPDRPGKLAARLGEVEGALGNIRSEITDFRARLPPRESTRDERIVRQTNRIVLAGEDMALYRFSLQKGAQLLGAYVCGAPAGQIEWAIAMIADDCESAQVSFINRGLNEARLSITFVLLLGTH